MKKIKHQGNFLFRDFLLDIWNLTIVVMQKNTSAHSTVTVGSSNGIVWILVKKQAQCAKRVILLMKIWEKNMETLDFISKF